MLVITSAAKTTSPYFTLHLKKNNYHLWRYLIAFLFVLFNVQCAFGSAEISNYIKRCCSSGIEHAHKNSLCQNYGLEVDAIPPLWRGLCYSTYGVCCSRQIQEQHCAAGRNAATTGSKCDEKFNTTAYSDCCRFCQVGLAVRASDNECDDPVFSDFSNDASYNICCGNNETQTNHYNEHKSRHEKAHDSSEKSSLDKNSDEEDSYGGKSVETPGDGAIVLQNDDDDICGKVPSLCEHICVNTKEAYECRCNPGYKLNENNITCSSITGDEPENDLENKPSVSINETYKDESMTNYEEEDNVDEDEEDEDDPSTFDDNIEDSDTCPIGYERKHNKCVDIDECALLRAKCKNNQYCHNTLGSYRCLNKGSDCPKGYQYSEYTNECEDINECEKNLDNCGRDEQCLNLKGSFRCTSKSDLSTLSSSAGRYQQGTDLNRCGSGFQFKNGRCADIDECAVDESACDSTQICTNDIGGFHCNCKIGFSLDTITNACSDINECSINNHNCLSSQRCDNTLGSYICTRLQSCGTGYTLNAETNICDDDDECAHNTHNCTPDYVCHNTMGSFRCRPVRHTSTTSTTTTTTSTTTTTTPQPPPATSARQYPHYRNHSFTYHNQEPSYNSRQTNSGNHIRDYSPIYVSPDGSRNPPCGIGFHRNYLGACVDFNECVANNPCGSHQRCINTNGSYRCQNLLQCGPGYKATPEGTNCIDIDECETGEHNCAENQICRNRNGGYVCSCPPGHQLIRLQGAYSRCVDINECEQEHPGVCPSNSQCLNTIGSYYCECKSGFQKSRENDRICLDMDECQEIPGLCQQKCVNFWGGYRCTCNSGYELSADNRTCNDLDECEVHKSYKLCMGFCNNVPGSYECSCPRGYTLAQDKNTCRDIDECATSDVCTGRNDICTNIRGSYKCTTIQCPYGYVNDPDQKNRCRQTSNICEGDDCYNKPSAYTYNFITLVSQLQIPPEGRTIFSLHGPVWYDDIDFDLKIVRIQAAANIEKASDYHFGTIKGKHEVHVTLKRSLDGPQDIELELSMTVFTKGLPRGKSVAKIFIIVSQYSF